MIALFVIVAALLVTLVARWWSGGRHRRCLERIALLERELGIWPPYELEAAARYDGIEASFEFKPGARWVVDDPGVIAFTDALAAKGLLGSAEAQRLAIEHKRRIERLMFVDLPQNLPSDPPEGRKSSRDAGI